MLAWVLTRLYAHLLKLYPHRFLDEFGEEMAGVFSQALCGTANSDTLAAIRRLKMVGLFFREVWDFPRAYLEARRYQASLGPEEASLGTSGEQDTRETWMGRHAPWGEALLGALPFILFGLAYLIEGITELSGHYGPVFGLLEGTLLDRPPNHPVIVLTPPICVYFVAALGLLFGVIKGFPRWSYAYLGMSIYFGWYYSNGRYQGVVYGSWAWLPLFAAILLGLLLARSLRPLAQLLTGAWNDWTCLSFALYAFALPIQTIIFFDSNWGVFELYGLVFDTVLLAAVALAFMRAHTTWGRVLSLEAAILTLVVKGIVMGWMGKLEGVAPGPVLVLIILLYLGLLLLPGVIGMLRRGVAALTSR